MAPTTNQKGFFGRVTRALKDRFTKPGNHKATVNILFAVITDRGAESPKVYAKYLVQVEQFVAERGLWEFVAQAQSKVWVLVPGKNRQERYNFQQAMAESWEPRASTSAGAVVFDDVKEQVSVEEGESLMRMVRGLGSLELQL